MTVNNHRKVFVAGSTGAVGRALRRIAPSDAPLLFHRRPDSASSVSRDPRDVCFDLADANALTAALASVHTVLQLIGTTKARFETGDTYDSSDIGTTQSLTVAAKNSGVAHFVLLSSVGAGRPNDSSDAIIDRAAGGAGLKGAYLHAKAKAEAIVVKSGIAYTILRPSAFDGEGHKAPLGMGSFTRLLGLSRFSPISVDDLARTLLKLAMGQQAKGVLEGEQLHVG